MGIIQMDGNRFGQIVKTGVVELMATDEILQTGRNKEIFLHQAQFPARGRRIIRIEHTGHVLGHVFRFNGSRIVALVESGQIDFRCRLGRPQAQSRCTLSVITRDNGIVRHCQNAMGVHPACPAILLFDMAAIPDIELQFGTREFPGITSGQQPVIGRFHLIPVDDFLLEHAIVVTDTIPDIGNIQSCHRIQKTGCQTSEPPITQRGVRLITGDLFHIDSQIPQGFFHILPDVETFQRILESTPDQKFH